MCNPIFHNLLHPFTTPFTKIWTNRYFKWNFSFSMHVKNHPFSNLIILGENIVYKFTRVWISIRFILIFQEQASHLTNPTSSQFMHFNATNSAVKWFLWRLFLDPLQILQGSSRNPPQTWQVLQASGLWEQKNKSQIKFWSVRSKACCGIDVFFKVVLLETKCWTSVERLRFNDFSILNVLEKFEVHSRKCVVFRWNRYPKIK